MDVFFLNLELIVVTSPNSGKSLVSTRAVFMRIP